MEISELYKMKGELITQSEVIQAKLQSVNQEIVKYLNEPSKIEIPQNGIPLENHVSEDHN